MLLPAALCAGAGIHLPGLRRGLGDSRCLRCKKQAPAHGVLRLGGAAAPAAPGRKPVCHVRPAGAGPLLFYIPDGQNRQASERLDAFRQCIFHSGPVPESGRLRQTAPGRHASVPHRRDLRPDGYFRLSGGQPVRKAQAIAQSEPRQERGRGTGRTSGHPGSGHTGLFSLLRKRLGCGAVRRGLFHSEPVGRPEYVRRQAGGRGEGFRKNLPRPRRHSGPLRQPDVSPGLHLAAVLLPGIKEPGILFLTVQDPFHRSLSLFGQDSAHIFLLFVNLI